MMIISVYVIQIYKYNTVMFFIYMMYYLCKVGQRKSRQEVQEDMIVVGSL